MSSRAYPYTCRKGRHLIENINQVRKRGTGPSGCEQCRREANGVYYASTKGIAARIRGELQAAINHRERLV
jgi:hypothetical protein